MYKIYIRKCIKGVMKCTKKCTEGVVRVYLEKSVLCMYIHKSVVGVHQKSVLKSVLKVYQSCSRSVPKKVY